MKRISKFFLTELFVIIFFAIACFIFFFPVLAGTNSFVSPPDTSELIYPGYYRIAYELTQNQDLPLWDQHLFCGFPLFAYPQYGIYYPLNMLFLIYPYDGGIFPYYAYEYLVIFHVFLAGWLMYILGRGLKFDRLISLIMGVIYMFCPAFVQFIVWGNQLVAYAWFPLAFFFTYKSLITNRPSLTYTALSAIALGIIILASPAQPAIMFLTIVALIAFYAFLSERKNKTDLLLILRNLFIIGSVGTLIGAITTMPAIEFTMNSIRFLGEDGSLVGNAKMNFHAFSHYSFGKENIPGFILTQYSTVAVGRNYFGIIPLLFAATAVLMIGKRKSLVFLLAILTISSVLYSFNLLLPRIAYFIPIINKIREPSRYIILAGFSISILAGFCIEYFLSYEFVVYLKGRIIKFAFLAVGLLSILILLLFAGINSLNMLIISLTAVSVFLFLLLIPHKSGVLITIGKISLLAVIFADLYSFKQLIFDKKHFDIDYYMTNMFLLKELKPSESEAPFRITPIESDGIWPYPTNAADIIGFYDSFGYGNPLLYKVFKYRNSVNFNSKYYDMLNVKYFVTSPESDHRISTLSKDIKKNSTVNNIQHLNLSKNPLNQTGEIIKYENTNRLGNAWIVDNILLTDNNSDVISQIEYYIDISKDALLKSSDFINQTSPLDKGTPALIANIKTTLYKSQQLVFKVSSNKPAFMVTSELYYPGWKAYVNGKQTRIYETNYILRGIFVPEGQSTVEFVFEPFSFYFGLALTVAGISLAFVFLILGFLRYKIKSRITFIIVLFANIMIFCTMLIYASALSSDKPSSNEKENDRLHKYSYDFWANFGNAKLQGDYQTKGNPWGKTIEKINVSEINNKPGIFCTSETSITFSNIKIGKKLKSVLNAKVGFHPSAKDWLISDGFRVKVEIIMGQNTDVLFNDYCMPEEPLKEIFVPLDKYIGQTVTFTFSVINDTGRNNSGDWALWLEPKIITKK